MSSRSKSTFSAASAAKALAGLPFTPFEVDWLAIDSAGALAVFLGDHEHTVPPASADAQGTATLIEVLRTTFEVAVAQSVQPAYRSSARATRGEPIFDVPRRSRSEPLHEDRCSGYPHLFVATDDGSVAVRAALLESGGHEALTRGPFAVVVDEIGWMTYEALHVEKACAGCRVLDLATDPRPRSPEAIAAMGFYAYAWGADGWTRVTSPSVRADESDLVALGAARVGRVELATRFEDSPWLPPRR